jgi:hypothetical protein
MLGDIEELVWSTGRLALTSLAAIIATFREASTTDEPTRQSRYKCNARSRSQLQSEQRVVIVVLGMVIEIARWLVLCHRTIRL